MNKNVKTYFLGISWFIGSLVISASQDILAKYLGDYMHSTQIAFLRFFFSTITLLPFIFYYGFKKIKTQHIVIHIARGSLLFLGILAWIFGLSVVQVSTATTLSFATPLFFIMLGYFFLSEKIIWQRWVVTIIGLVGMIVTLKPHTSDFNPWSTIFIFAAIGFAMLDVINKKFVIKESMLSMLFYSDIVTTFLAFPLALHYWKSIEISDIILCLFLGINANLLLYCLLKAFSLVDGTATAPYRYFELIISSLGSYLIFGDIPSTSTLYGAAILIPSTLFIIYSENKEIKKLMFN